MASLWRAGRSYAAAITRDHQADVSDGHRQREGVAGSRALFPAPGGPLLYSRGIGAGLGERFKKLLRTLPAWSGYPLRTPRCRTPVATRTASSIFPWFEACRRNAARR